MTSKTIESIHQNWTEISDPTQLTENPVVSVLMLTYNHGDYLAEAIEGVVNQITDFPFELLISEDCSIDNTFEIASQYQKKFPRLIRIFKSNKNSGAQSSIKQLVLQSQAKYISFCEGDDYWISANKLQKQVELISSDINIGIVHTDYKRCLYIFNKWRVIDKHGFRATHSKENNLEGDLFNTVFSEMPAITCTVMYRTAVVKQYINSQFFDPKIPLGDLPLLAFATSCYKVAYIKKATAVYRLSPNSATRGNPEKLMKFELAVASVYEKFIKAFGKDKRFDHRFKEIILLKLSLASFNAGNREKFNEYIKILQLKNSVLMNMRMVRIRKFFASNIITFPIGIYFIRFSTYARGRLEMIKLIFAEKLYKRIN